VPLRDLNARFKSDD